MSVVARVRQAWRRPAGWNLVLVTALVVGVNDLGSWLVSQLAYRAIGVTFEPGATQIVANWAPVVVPTFVAPLTTVPRLRLSYRLNRTVELLEAEIRRREELQAELEYQASHDALTGVLNRRGFWAAGPPLARDGSLVLVVDINRFKTVNDTHGHAVGDDVLRAVGRVLGSADGRALSGRLGGDEFAVVIPSGDLTVAEDLRERLGSLTVELPDGEPLVATAAVGIGTVVGGQSLDSALGAVDDAMYAAKRGSASPGVQARAGSR